MRGQEAVLCALGHEKFLVPTRIPSEGLYCTLFVIPVILPFYFWDKTRQERMIAKSNAEWVIVRSGALTNGKRRGTPRHGSRIGRGLWTVRISRSDVAKFILDG